jgi:hypothetical protein
MIISDGAFWLLAFALYLIDNVKLIEREELVLIETLSLRIEPRLTPFPVELRGRCIVLLNPLLPFLLAFKIRWRKEGGRETGQARHDRRIILGLQRRVLPLRILASLSFAALFLAGPILTWRVGLASALLTLTPVHFALLLSLLFFISIDPFGLTTRHWLLFALECVVCPMYLPTLLRRLSWQTELASNGVAFASRYSPIESLPELRSAVDARLSEFGETSDDMQKEGSPKYLGRDD